MDLIKKALKDEEVLTFSKKLTTEEIEDNICLLYEQTKANDICRKCLGEKKCQSDIENMQSYLVKENKIISRCYYSCQYKNASIDESIDVLFFPQNFNIGEVYINEKRSEAFKAILNYNNSSGEKGIYLYGPFGNGKTFLLMNLAKQLAKKGKKIIFAYYPELVRKAKSAIGDGTLEKLIVRLKNIDILMLDDVGGEMNSAFIRDEFLGPILQYRMLASLPIFMTSNYDLNTLKDHLSGTKDESNLLKAARLIERMAYMMNIVELKDQNYRK